MTAAVYDDDKEEQDCFKWISPDSSQYMHLFIYFYFTLFLVH